MAGNTTTPLTISETLGRLEQADAPLPRASHERLYAVASDQLPPYDASVDYREGLFY
ncbi:MAG: hypothetical protein ACOCVI_02375 [Planctomycetota bacterium]